MRIAQNVAALQAHRHLARTQSRLGKSLEKLSSGFRINRAADDASGLANSETLRAQIGGLKVAMRNIQDAVSLVQTAEGALTEVHAILQRMRDLAVQSANTGANDAAALAANKGEIDQLKAELNRIAFQTQYGTKTLLAGEVGAIGKGAAKRIEAALNPPPNSTTAEELEKFIEKLRKKHPSFAASMDAIESRGLAAADLAAAINAYFAEVAIGVDGKTLADYVIAGPAVAGDAEEEGNEGSGGGGVITYAIAPGADLSEIVVGTRIAFEQAGFTFQTGANAGQTQTVFINSTATLWLGETVVNGSKAHVEDVDVTTFTGASVALRILDQALAEVSTSRAALGAFQNGVESRLRTVTVAAENLSAAQSRIRDVDVALEVMSLSRGQILAQAGTAMLAQANQAPRLVLSLLQ